MENMTREMFKELFGLNDNDSGMEYADEQNESGLSWWEIAKSNISAMNYLLLNDEYNIEIQDVRRDKDGCISRNSFWEKIFRFSTTKLN